MSRMVKRNGAAAAAPLFIPPATVAAIGRAIFGAHWQSPFAKALKVQDQTMRRWTNDGCPLSLVGAMRTLLQDRAGEIGVALTSLAEFRDEA